jgi:uncharacterized protein
MRFLLVDAHSVIFAWPVLRALHQRHAEAAREQLIARLTAYQDATGTRVVIAFDGQGKKNTSEKRPSGVQIFYSASKKTADDILERLVAKYSSEHDMTVASNDRMVAQTVITFGGTAISVESLLDDLERVDEDLARRIRALRKK